MDEQNTRKRESVCTDHEIGMGAGVCGSATDAAMKASSPFCSLGATNDNEHGEDKDTDEKCRAAGLEGGGKRVRLELQDHRYGHREGLAFAEASSRSTTGSSRALQGFATNQTMCLALYS